MAPAVIAAILLGAASAVAQVTQPGVNTATQLVNSFNITDFEDAAFWRAEMPSDQGLITLRRRDGQPPGKEPPEDLTLAEPDEFALGVRVDFYKRGFNTFSVLPVRPIPVPGITKEISVWVIGRNFNHTLKVQFLDFYGQSKELTLGKLNFVGWKQLTVQVPPSIVQSTFHYVGQSGIRITGFKIETDPMESFGTYYVYFDGARAQTDLFTEAPRDGSNLPDGW